MKKRLKKLLRPLLFTLGGALAGLAYYYLVGCSSGSCAITSNPLSSMLYLGLAGLILSGAFCPCCGWRRSRPAARWRWRTAATRDPLKPAKSTDV